jgi:hypothetical protein
MTVPKDVRLLTQRVVVKMAKDLEWDDNGHRHEAFGLFVPQERLIYLRKGMAPDYERQTFLHENLHLIIETANILTDDEEALVHRLSPILLSWLRENPDAVEYLQEMT